MVIGVVDLADSIEDAVEVAHIPVDCRYSVGTS